MTRKTSPLPLPLQAAIGRQIVITPEERKRSDLERIVEEKAQEGANDPFAAFSEWANELDEMAYADL